jgi:hypothetical protein
MPRPHAASARPQGRWAALARPQSRIPSRARRLTLGAHDEEPAEARELVDLRGEVTVVRAAARVSRKDAPRAGGHVLINPACSMPHSAPDAHLEDEAAGVVLDLVDLTAGDGLRLGGGHGWKGGRWGAGAEGGLRAPAARSPALLWVDSLLLLLSVGWGCRGDAEEKLLAGRAIKKCDL